MTGKDYSKKAEPSPRVRLLSNLPPAVVATPPLPLTPHRPMTESLEVRNAPSQAGSGPMSNKYPSPFKEHRKSIPISRAPWSRDVDEVSAQVGRVATSHHQTLADWHNSRSSNSNAPRLDHLPASPMPKCVIILLQLQLPVDAHSVRCTWRTSSI